MAHLNHGLNDLAGDLLSGGVKALGSILCCWLHLPTGQFLRSWHRLPHHALEFWQLVKYDTLHVVSGAPTPSMVFSTARLCANDEEAL